MNAISYIVGDAEITDFPSCSARPLAALVQWCNDALAGPDGYLSPGDSMLVLDLGWQTVGTAGAPHRVVHAWMAELLSSPTWGAVRYAENAAIKAIFDIAELHRMVASGDTPPIPKWYTADRAGRAAARTISPTSNAPGLYAVRAAYQSTAVAGNAHSARVDAVTGNVLRAHALAIASTATTDVVRLTREAIRSWRHLTEFCGPGEPGIAYGATQRVGAPA
jgi:hypothetical protein